MYVRPAEPLTSLRAGRDRLRLRPVDTDAQRRREVEATESPTLVIVGCMQQGAEVAIADGSIPQALRRL